MFVLTTHSTECIAKVILFTIHLDVQDATGCIQLCGEQMSGIELAVHALRFTFTLDKYEVVYTNAWLTQAMPSSPSTDR